MTAILLFILFVLLLFLVVRNAQLEADLIAAQLERESLERSVRENLGAIRARLYYLSEAEAICTALETTLQARCRVDLARLERAVNRLREQSPWAPL